MEEWQSWFNAPVLLQRSPLGKNRRWRDLTGGSNQKELITQIPKDKWMYITYILKSEKTGRYYYGATSNLENRLKAHNSGKVKSTKSGRPWNIHYFENFESKSEALQRERFFKSIEGYRFLKENNIT